LTQGRRKYMAKKPMIDWHRLFTIAVEQNFIDYIVLKIERERDLSIKQHRTQNRTRARPVHQTAIPRFADYLY